MKQIIFNFNMFDMGQKALIIDTDNDSDTAIATYSIKSIDSAGATIAKACNDVGILNIHLYGEESYLKQIIIPDIKENLIKLNYTVDNLEIEVN